jgi:hypothetical protein
MYCLTDRCQVASSLDVNLLVRKDNIDFFLTTKQTAHFNILQEFRPGSKVMLKPEGGLVWTREHPLEEKMSGGGYRDKK